MRSFEASLIGCRISIISKAKIRYEGFFDSVDFDSLDEPAIKLTKVRSFGTEDRQCARQVAPRNEEYEEVVFCARDLEDVRLVQSSVFLNEDSAIMSAAPGTSINPKQPAGSTVNRSPEVASSSTISMAPTQSNFSSLQSSSLGGLNGLQQLPQSTFDPPGSRPGPVGTALTNNDAPDINGPRPFGDGRSEVDNNALSFMKRFGMDGQNTAFNDNFNTGMQQNPNDPNINRQNRDPYHRRLNNTQNRSFLATGMPTMQDFNRRGSHDHRWSGQRGWGSHNWYPRGMRGANYGWGRRYPSNQPLDNSSKFQGDYDYEKASAELAAELEKISVSTKSNSVDGDNCREDESTESGGETCYDKSKSFFDTISSEMMDRAKGRNPQGMNRRDERILNTATFGTTSYYPRRGGYSKGGGYGHRRMGANYWQPVGVGNNRNHPHSGGRYPATSASDNR